jgi:hypothetical protein
MSVIPTGASKGSSSNLEAFSCSKISFLLYLYVELQNYEVWIAGKIIAQNWIQVPSTCIQIQVPSTWIQIQVPSTWIQIQVASTWI